MVEKSYNKTFIDFKFGRHKDLSTRKSNIHRGRKTSMTASVNITFSGRQILMSTEIEVSNCILCSTKLNMEFKPLRNIQIGKMDGIFRFKSQKPVIYPPYKC